MTLLCLELLVAADITLIITVTPTVESVGVIAVIAVIGTFLSLSLELEITGRRPWQHQVSEPRRSCERHRRPALDHGSARRPALRTATVSRR